MIPQCSRAEGKVMKGCCSLSHNEHERTSDHMQRTHSSTAFRNRLKLYGVNFTFTRCYTCQKLLNSQLQAVAKKSLETKTLKYMNMSDDSHYNINIFYHVFLARVARIIKMLKL